MKRNKNEQSVQSGCIKCWYLVTFNESYRQLLLRVRENVNFLKDAKGYQRKACFKYEPERTPERYHFQRSRVPSHMKSLSFASRTSCYGSVIAHSLHCCFQRLVRINEGSRTHLSEITNLLDQRQKD